MREFKVGDKVVAVKSIDGKDVLVGKRGTICCIDGAYKIGIKFDEKIDDGHTCDEHCEVGYGRYTYKFDEIQFVKKGKKFKMPVIEKYLVIEDSCNNSHGIYDNYKVAEEKAKEISGNTTVYKLLEVAKISSVKQVKKIAIPRKRVKKRARRR